MTSEMDMDAYNAVSSAAVYMTGRSPGMAPFYGMMGRRQTTEPYVTVRILVENGKPVLEYGTAFVKGLERSLLGSILYMQCMKLAMHHCDHRRREPYDLYKLASDLVVSEYGRNMVDCSVPGNLDIINRLYPTVWGYWDKFSKYDFDAASDLFLEKVFDILRDVEHDGTDDGDGDSDDSESNDGNGDEGDQGSDGEQGSPDETGADGGEDGSYGLMEKYFSGESADIDTEGWEDDDMVTADVQAAASRADRSGALARMAGNLPVLIAELNRIRVNVRELFRHFIDSIDDDEFEFTWNRRDRRFRRSPIVINPGRITGTTHRILLAADVSGSMYFCGAIGKCMSLMESIVNGMTIDVCYWDDECSDLYHTPKSIEEISVHGGGSTNPQCVIDKVRELHEQYDGIVFLTDCEFNWACPVHPRRIMILRSGRGDIPDWCVHHMEIDALMRERI